MNATLTPPAPTAAPETGLMTAEEFYNLPDNGQGYELIDGQLRERVVSNRSSRLGFRLGRWMDEYCDRTEVGYVYGSDQNYACFPDAPRRVRRADSSFIALARMTWNEYEHDGNCPIAPDIAVEVVSPSNDADELLEKVEQWLAAGVRLVWVVSVRARLVFAFRLTGHVERYRVGDTVTAPDILPDFACPVAALFRRPGEPATPPADGGAQ